MPGRYIRIVQLWIREGQETAFDLFEAEAAQTMSRHGGRIDSAIRIDPAAAGQGDPPYEVHIVGFPTRDHFAAYAADPETLARKPRRDRIFSRTVSWEGAEAGPY